MDESHFISPEDLATEAGLALAQEVLDRFAGWDPDRSSSASTETVAA